MLLVWLVGRAIGQSLDLLRDLIIVFRGHARVLPLKLALDSLLLHLEGLLIPTLLLHLVHEQLVSVNLLV